jgi:hypothetical protein
LYLTPLSTPYISHLVNMSTPDSKDFSSKDDKHVDNSKSTDHIPGYIQRATSVTMTPELFDKLYLAPLNTVKGDLRRTFANPTPLAVLGLAMALTPFSCDIMGWRGAGGNGAASIGSYYFMGGLLMIIGAIGEWIMGMLSLPIYEYMSSF